MIKLQDTIIQTSTEDVINTLKFELAQKGLNRFAVVRLNGENLQTNLFTQVLLMNISTLCMVNLIGVQ